MPGNPRVGIVMGSRSDWPTMCKAAEVLDELEIPYETEVVSAHRTPEKMLDYARSARSRGLALIVAGAGGAAHLPGMLAAATELPVLGVPVKSRALNGLDSLLSIVQMPRGVPVATVAINNSRNAGLLAARILGSSDEAVRERVAAYGRASRTEVLERAERLETLGWREYLESNPDR